MVFRSLFVYVGQSAIRTYAPGVHNADNGCAAACVLMARCTRTAFGFSNRDGLLFATAQEELLSSLGLDVTVTRREDATFAPNGYIYNIYFDGETQVLQQPQTKTVRSSRVS